MLPDRSLVFAAAVAFAWLVLAVALVRGRSRSALQAAVVAVVLTALLAVHLWSLRGSFG